MNNNVAAQQNIRAFAGDRIQAGTPPPPPMAEIPGAIARYGELSEELGRQIKSLEDKLSYVLHEYEAETPIEFNEPEDMPFKTQMGSEINSHNKRLSSLIRMVAGIKNRAAV